MEGITLTFSPLGLAAFVMFAAMGLGAGLMAAHKLGRDAIKEIRKIRKNLESDPPRQKREIVY